jgi:Mn-dependent DtxR family transcriptional regulator
MERIHMNLYLEIIYRLRAGESERSISRDLGISRPTVHKYRLKAVLEGYLDHQREFPGREERTSREGIPTKLLYLPLITFTNPLRKFFNRF